MKTLKISIFTKFLVFVLNTLFLFGLFIIPENIFSKISITPFFGLLIWNLLFYFVLKNKKIAIILFTILNFLIFLSSSIVIFKYYILDEYYLEDGFFKNFSLSVIILIIFLSFISFLKNIFLFLKVKKGIENTKEKFLTEKIQGKIFFSIFIFQIIFFIIFRYGYYLNNGNIKTFPEKFFHTKFEDKNINDENNIYNDFLRISKKYEKKLEFPVTNNSLLMEKFPEKFSKSQKNQKKESITYENKYEENIILKCLYENICYGDLFFYKVLLQNTVNDEKFFLKIFTKEEQEFLQDKINKKNFKINGRFLGEQKTITKQLDKINIKIFIKRNIDFLNYFSEENQNFFEEFKNFTKDEKFFKVYLTSSSIKILRDFTYKNEEKIFYFIEKGDEKSALKIIEDNFKIFDKIISGDSDLLSSIIANDGANQILTTIFYILEYKEVSPFFKEELKNILKNVKLKINVENILKYDYKLLNLAFTENSEDFLLGTSFLSFKNTRNLYGTYISEIIKNGLTSEEAKKEVKEKTSFSFLKSNYFGKKIFEATISDSLEIYLEKNNFTIFLKNELIKTLEN